MQRLNAACGMAVGVHFLEQCSHNIQKRRMPARGMAVDVHVPGHKRLGNEANKCTQLYRALGQGCVVIFLFHKYW